MADISGTYFYRALNDKFEMSASHTRFQQDYLFAVNSVLTEIGNLWDFETKPSRSSNTQDDIDLDQKYEPALFWGTAFYLIDLGQRSGELTLNDAETKYNQRLAQVEERQHHDNQQTDEADVVGLGYQE